MTTPSFFWTLLRSNAYGSVQCFVLFLSGKKWRYRLSKHMLICVVNIRPAGTFWISTHYPLSRFTLDWSRNLLHDPMWNMAVNNISYPIYMYPLKTNTEKNYITKIIPFFLYSVYMTRFDYNASNNNYDNGVWFNWWISASWFGVDGLNHGFDIFVFLFRFYS